MRVKNAFTLVELLAVIIIIGIIATIAVPVVNVVTENSRKEMFKTNAISLIKQALYEKLSDDSLDLTQINTENMYELLGLPSDDYDSIIFEEYDDEILIKVIGANKWKGLAVCGTDEILTVAENNCELDSEAPTMVYGPNGSASYIKSGNVIVIVTDDLLDKTSLKYVWTTTADTPSDGEYVNSFENRGNIPMPKSTGRFYLHIIAKDFRNNITREVRDFLIDGEGPVITMNGTDPVNINVGGSYTDAGATATDNIDGNVTNKIVSTTNLDINNIGSYYVKYDVLDNSGNQALTVTRTVNVTVIKNFAYTGNYETWAVPMTGRYKIEVFGAQGGGTGGKGGYAYGEMNLTEGQSIYGFVGGQGETGIFYSFVHGGGGKGGFNGGGNGGVSQDYYNRPADDPLTTSAGGGGGATDVRIGGLALTNRVIVAGGGGGHGKSNTDPTYGVGGGLDGTKGLGFATTNVEGGNGGTQAAGGAGAPNPGGGAQVYHAATSGVSGIGGIGSSRQVYGDNAGPGGGGGGGYYGGGGGGSASSWGRGGMGGGGSSYIGSLINAGTTAGVNTGNGKIVITLLVE